MTAVPSGLLVDTDILIDYLRGHPASIVWLQSQQDQIHFSVVTVAELYVGVRDDAEANPTRSQNTEDSLITTI